jgi:hypothetical protein
MAKTKKAEKAGALYVYHDDKDRMRAAAQLRDKAARSVDKAKNHIEAGEYLDSAKESTLAMELSAKSILAACVGHYPKTHDFSHNDTVEALKEIDLPSHSPLAGYLLIECARAFLAANMWATTHNALSYGYQEVLVTPESLFQEDYARWALTEAQACRDRASMLLANPEKLKFAKRTTSASPLVPARELQRHMADVATPQETQEDIQ